MTFQAMTNNTAQQHTTDKQTYTEHITYYDYEEDNMETVALSGIHPLTLLVVVITGLGMWAGIFYFASLILNLIVG